MSDSTHYDFWVRVSYSRRKGLLEMPLVGSVVMRKGLVVSYGDKKQDGISLSLLESF